MAQPQSGTKYNFTISNESKFVVDEVRISPSDKNIWGDDYTGNSVLKPGQTASIPDLAPGQYDVKFTDAGGHDCVLKAVPVFSEMSWSLTAPFIGNCPLFGTAGTGAAESGGRLTITNNSRLEVLAVQTSRSGNNQWGPDRTGDTTLRPGGSLVLKELATGPNDIRFVVEDGASCLLKGINPAEQPAWELTMQWLRGCERSSAGNKAAAASTDEKGFRVTLHNSSGYGIHEIRVSPAGANKWGADRTGEQILGSGESIILKNISAGQYDLKIADRSGTDCVVKDMKISGHQAWNITTQSLGNCPRFGTAK